jgi:UDP-glucose 4-epimerase
VKTALVTGGYGFIGSNLVHELVRRGVRVTVYDNLDPKCGGNQHNLDGISDHVELVEADIRDATRLTAAVRGTEYVFHCAARTSHPTSMTEPLEDVAVNCVGTLNLLEAVRTANPEAKLVYVGTSTQIGRSAEASVTELHGEFPLDIYSANKSAAEKYVLIYGHSYGLRTSVVRLANNFGPRANVRSADFGFINFFVGLALRDRELTIFGEGKQLRTISFVDDSVDALLTVAARDDANGQVWFAVADRQTSVADIARQITVELGGTVKFVPWPQERAAIEIGDAVISNAKIAASLDWRPKVGLQDGLRRTREYFATRLEYYL